MTRRVPPAGHPFGAGDVASAFAGWGRPGREAERFRALLAADLGGVEVRLRSSGRDALLATLLACRALRPDRKDVIVGAYTCWSVPAAIRRAGLRARPLDLDPATLDFDDDALATEDGRSVLAIVTHHLCGFPNDTARLAEAAKRWGCFLIDDAAQAYGGRFGGRPLGTTGDAGVLSFGRGKGCPALAGGAVVFAAGSPLAGALPPPQPAVRGSGEVARAALHALFFRPALYGVPASLPFLRVGVTVYDEAFPTGGPSGAGAAIGARLLRSMAAERERRRAVAGELRALFAELPGIVVPVGRAGGESAPIRLPLLFPANGRARYLARAARLGASGYYPAPVTRIPRFPRESLAGEGPWPGAEAIAARLVTLPVHRASPASDRDELVRIAREECR